MRSKLSAELVFIDDGSEDDTGKWVTSYRGPTRHIRNETSVGVARALNQGVSVASGGLIMRMDADDVVMPTRLSDQFAVMAARPTIDVLGSSYLYMSPSGRRLPTFRPNGWVSPEDVPLLLAFSNPVCHPSTMFRLRWIQNVGGYPEGSTLEDYSLWLRESRSVQLAIAPDPLIRWRLRPDSMSKLGAVGAGPDLARRMLPLLSSAVGHAVPLEVALQYLDPDASKCDDVLHAIEVIAEAESKQVYASMGGKDIARQVWCEWLLRIALQAGRRYDRLLLRVVLRAMHSAAMDARATRTLLRSAFRELLL